MNIKSIIPPCAIVLALIVLLSFSKKIDENFIEYFINPELENINYRTFESKNGLVPKMIFKQMITKNTSTNDEILMEYIFMNGDSVPITGGLEKIAKDRIEVLEQHLYINGKKLNARKIEGNLWKMNDNFPIPVSIEFFDDRTGFGIKSDSNTYARFIDTLGQKSFIVELKSEIRTYLNEQPLDTMLSTSKRWYVKNKGLVYHGEKTNGQSGNYYLIENK